MLESAMPRRKGKPYTLSHDRRTVSEIDIPSAFDPRKRDGFDLFDVGYFQTVANSRASGQDIRDEPAASDPASIECDPVGDPKERNDYPRNENENECGPCIFEINHQSGQEGNYKGRRQVSAGQGAHRHNTVVFEKNGPQR